MKMNLNLQASLKFILFLLIPVVVSIVESMLPSRPDFDTESTEITAVSGHTATLPCSVENKGEYKVIWMNPRKTLISRDDSRYIDDSRMSVERPKIRNWNLLIREVRYNDSGEYMCQINTKPVLIKRLNLIVKVPPEIIEDDAPLKRQVVEGTTVELVCNATGVPPPIVTWFRKTNEQAYPVPDYGQSNLVGEVLILHNITRYCDGIYECEATNGFRPTALKTFEISVFFPPEVRLLTTRMGQGIGKETMLECKISASPHGSIMWMKDGTEITSTINYRYRTEIFDESPHEKALVLNIIDIKKEDFGYYTCEASNSQGSDSETMVLYEYKEFAHRTTTVLQTTWNPTPTPGVMVSDPNNNAIYQHNGNNYDGQSKKRPGAPEIGDSVYYNYNSGTVGHTVSAGVWGILCPVLMTFVTFYT